MRREFSAKVKAAAFERANGHCEMCTAVLYTGKFHYDHCIPDALGGDPTLTNCVVACVNCHGTKTRQEDIPRIAKAARQHLRDIGAETKRYRWPKRRMTA